RGADHALAAAGALAPRAVRVVDLAVLVGEQVEVEAVLLLEGLVRRSVVARDTEHRDAEAAELREVVVQLARLDRAARRVVLRVEVEEVGLPAQGLARDGLAVPVRERERGRGVAALELHRAPPPIESRPRARASGVRCASRAP